MKTSIVLPYFGKWELTHARLMEIYQNVLFNHNENLEVILINDASVEPECDTGVAFWQKPFNTNWKALRYHRNEKNLGFGGSMNYGAKMAQGDILILLSNDVLSNFDFVAKIVLMIQENDRQLIGGELVDYPAGWNEFEIGQKNYYVPYANGWLLACTKSVWESMGGFDMRFGLFDFEDVDLSTRALELGYNLSAINDKRLRHIGGATIYNLGINRMEQTQKNRQIYISKWGDRLAKIGRQYDHRS